MKIQKYFMLKQTSKGFLFCLLQVKRLSGRSKDSHSKNQPKPQVVKDTNKSSKSSNQSTGSDGSSNNQNFQPGVVVSLATSPSDNQSAPLALRETSLTQEKEACSIDQTCTQASMAGKDDITSESSHSSLATAHKKGRVSQNEEILRRSCGQDEHCKKPRLSTPVIPVRV